MATDSSPRGVTAGEREAGALCAHCGTEVARGDETLICRDCGAVHHAPCWHANQGCSSYECTPADKAKILSSAPMLTISREELSAVQPLTPRASFSINAHDDSHETRSTRWNRTAVAAFIVAVLGIPLFGLVTGLIAIVIACVALAGHIHGRRGMSLAVVAIVLGLFDVIGWAVALSQYLGAPHSAVALGTLALDPESLDELPERISRAMRANVIIESASGLGRNGIGSGVILKVRNGIAHIVTNRHTVDLNYTGDARSERDASAIRSDVHVVTVGQRPVPATVEWVAPHGVDLAIITAPVLLDEVQEAHWDIAATPRIGDSVFAIGNPHGLGWTHSAGDISQIRRQTYGDYQFRVLQTTAAINPGNSGGGLYDSEGRLIGINTMTGDKRFAEGLGFSIALPTLLELVSDRLEIPQKNPADK